MPALWFETAKWFEIIEPAGAVSILLAASGLDYGLGDPWNWLHPVQVMGWAIAYLSKILLSIFKRPFTQRLAGIALAIGLVGGSGLLGWGLVGAAAWLHPVAGWGLQVVMLASCLAGRSLRNAAEAVLKPLEGKEWAIARRTLSNYVGRETETLSASEMYRAVMETISENAIDGVFAPLFYALVGTAAGVGSVPLALAYKAASTLDSMVGYRRAPYTHLGWCSARLEDGLTWVPCRLSVLMIALLSKRPAHVIKLCRRDAIADLSPNAGWSECAYAAALDVQLGGANVYQGVITQKPLLGDAVRPITPAIIRQGMALTRRVYCGLLGIGILVTLGAVII
ncbi:MAG: adenosylcobinamide-phosphate synthase CbiB [Cyanobacteria bacterium P01_H01_bin.119]